MDRAEKVILTNMCMVCCGGKVLALNKLNKEYSGVTFPGGHVEPGESFTRAVIREVREETGLTISEPRLCGIKDWPTEDGGRYVVLLYRADRFEGTLASSHEGEVFWTELDGFAEEYGDRFAEGFDLMLRVFTDDDVSEFYYTIENGEWRGELI